MGEKTEKKFEQKGIPLLKLVRKNVVLMILITVLCTLLFAAYSIAFVKPTYTATSSVILRMSSQEGGADTDVSLAQRYLPTIADIVVSPAVINKAHEIYKTKNPDSADKINATSISVEYGERSLIFAISYNDTTAKGAEEKTMIVIQAATDHMQDGVLNVEHISLIPTDNEIHAVEKSGTFKYIASGFAIGVVVAFVVVVLKYALDTTVTDRREFEEVTGVDVLSTIAKNEDK